MSIPVFKPFMHDGDRYLTATDAFCVATYGHQVITTPNMKLIPQPFNNESDIIQARTDVFAIPRQEAYADDSSMMYAWFRPTFASDFTPISPGNLFGQLKTDIVGHLKRLYKKANTAVGWAHAMRAVYERFQQAMAWHDIVIIVAEYQRWFLDIWAVIDYYEIYQASHAIRRHYAQDVAITTKVHAAGVPVWLIRDARLVNANMNIVKVVSFTPPDDLVIGMYHDPVKLFAQPFDIINRGPNNRKRHEAARQPYSNFEKLPVSTPQVEQMVTRESLVGRARVDKGKAKMSAKPAPYNATAPRQNKAVSGRDKWSDIDHPYMPPMNSFFKIALEDANKDIIRIKHPRDKMDDGYSLPDPGLFVNVLSPQSLVKYLANWLACRPTWIERVYDERPRPLPRAQNWRDFLISQHAQEPSNTRTSGKTSKSKAATALLFQKEVPVLRALWAGPTNVHWRGKDIAISTLDNPPADLARQIVYEICEQSFRYELLDLDEHLGRDARKDKEARKERMELLRSIFPSKSLKVWNRDLPQENDGLNAPSFDAALPYFESFRKVLSAWEHFPESLKQPFDATGREHNIWKGMKECCLFYVQSYFDNTGRPPVVPHLLYSVA
ncbi:hypothetical protein DFJ58DRAFT_844036 [Suillus subalutaceus]|uniref:uncharacterized protein n=1 Tax=Suillus subalutaceus TaxID=48586 RepID=UPI001B869E3A|nr:uncharacterized protein DFJ58DRAFT_844036 [Suillus subalutaceus]KAG1844543.1 hypothetical protein DFJ58DRAFT_844036 [Suillus subalutaceus]